MRFAGAVALALLLGLGWQGEAEAQEAKQALELEVPASFVLGRDATAVLRVSDPGEPIRFFTNVGSIAATTTNDGKLEAVYSPPSERFPQVAIIVAANADYSLLAWKLLPLHGQPKIKIESIRRANVVAIVGEQRFGPVRTNGAGKASLQIVAPPGVTEAKLETTNRLGVVSHSQTPLNPPEFSRLLALCPTGESDDVLLFVIDELGQPASAANVQVSSSATTEEPRPLGPGLFAARMSAGTASDAEDIQVSASLAGTSKSTGACTGKRPGALPESLDLQLSQTSFSAGQDAIRVVIQPRFPEGARRRTPSLEISADFGEVSAINASGGEYSATWTLPNSLEARKNAQVLVRSKGSKPVSQSQEITLAPGPVSVVQLVVKNKELRGNGEDKIRVQATVEDAFGNPIEGASLEGSGQAIGAFAEGEIPGQYMASYGPVVAYDASSDQISVRESSTNSSDTVSIRFLPMKRRALADLRLGYATNFGAISAPSAMLSLGYRTPLLDDSVIVGGSVGFYRSTSSEMAESAPLDLEMIGVPLMLNASYEHELTIAKVYAGLGGGLVYADSTLSSELSGKNRVRKARPGGGGFVGARIPAGIGHVALQASYWMATIDDESISGNLLGFTADLGYGFEI